MPELPEVETTRLGIAPLLIGQSITELICRNPKLRWPVPDDLAACLTGQRCQAINRRAKYLLAEFGHGTLLIHLGMSGSLRWLERPEPPKKHDHIDLLCANGGLLRYHDPRRFGAWLWLEPPVAEHALLAHLGPEPLTPEFSGDYLYQHAQHRRIAVKTLIMDARCVVGVGNIYANEALFLAGIRPDRAANRISRQRYQTLAAAIKTVLDNAIRQGGTTLRDFVNSQGKPGYFQQQLAVYGRKNQPCRQCGQPLMEQRLANRSSVFCPLCQR
ncbi:MAG: bifunctional DNA-formamidopyrimidine glycosylase/DNA-(apurinic or apyrimidinic site) lyase [Methylococcales bacterium]|nr:bifunctional DNA-formamidopyrimidine glycosylase/DNA-(apurinic or apyrimidinic site) lyase [Methylococcales bacterium]